MHTNTSMPAHKHAHAHSLVLLRLTPNLALPSRAQYAYETYERPFEDGSGGGSTTYTTFKESTEDEIAE